MGEKQSKPKSSDRKCQPPKSKIKKGQLQKLIEKKKTFIQTLEKDQHQLLSSVDKENADKFIELKQLEKTANQSKVWQTFTIMALDRLRSQPVKQDHPREERKDASNQSSDYFKLEMDFLKTSSTMPLPQAKDQLIDLLSLFLKSETTFNHVPYWQKRAQFLTMSRPKSILDIQDPAFYKNLMQQGSRSHDGGSARDNARREATSPMGRRDVSPIRISSN